MYIQLCLHDLLVNNQTIDSFFKFSEIYLSRVSNRLLQRTCRALELRSVCRIADFPEWMPFYCLFYCSFYNRWKKLAIFPLLWYDMPAFQKHRRIIYCAHLLWHRANKYWMEFIVLSKFYFDRNFVLILPIAFVCKININSIEILYL